MEVALITTEEEVEAFGLRSISSYLKSIGHGTTLLFMKSRGPAYSERALEETRQRVSSADVIGLSCLSRSSEKAVQVLESLRPLGKILVWGGVHATLNPERCVDHADVVCRGEGEGFMQELLQKIDGGENWRDIPNAAYRANGRIQINDVRPLIEDLDELDVMDFSHENEFHLKGDRYVRIRDASDASEAIAFNGTRGCPFHCAYCSNARLKELYAGKGRYARRTSIGKLLEDAERLKKNFPDARCINFFDEDFCARKTSEIRRFAEEYPARIGMPFEAMVSPLRLTAEKMECLVRVGLWRINMGIESGSDRTKKEIYDRHMSNDAVMRAAEIIHRHPSVVAYYFFIIGNPYETSDDLIATADFIGSLPPPFFLRVYNLIFIPGTHLYDTALKDGVIHGIEDSGFELDFLGGFNYKKHPWKKKNIYLNGLIYLMAGKVTKRRLGLVPRSWLPSLLRPSVVTRNEKHTRLIRGLILSKIILFRLRSFLARILKKIFKDPTSIYSLRDCLRIRSRAGTASAAS